MNFILKQKLQYFFIAVIISVSAPTLIAKQIITPNTGSLTPGFPPGQLSQPGLGQGPSNPGPYLKPDVTPPIWDQSKTCTPGMLGTVPQNGVDSPGSDNFNRSYQCFSQIQPGFNSDHSNKSPPWHHQQSGIAARPKNYANFSGLENGIPGISEKPDDRNQEPAQSQIGEPVTSSQSRGVRYLPNQ